MKKFATCVGVILMCVYSVSAQQEQQYTQYLNNYYSINPAVGGTQDYIDLKASYRYQWLGFESAPKTFYLSGHTSLGKEFGNAHAHHRGEHQYWHGIGAFMYSDDTETIKRQSYYLSYSLNLPIANHGRNRLAFGTFVGLKQFTYDPTNHLEDLAHQGDDVIEHARRVMRPDLNVGIWYYTPNFFAGGSVYQLLNQSIDINLTESGNLAVLKRHLFLTAGTKLEIGYDIFLIPSIMIKYNSPAPLSVDISSKIAFHEKYWLGGALRAGDSFSVIGGTVINEKLEMSYSFDLISSKIRTHSYGSHEILIAYRLKHPGHIDCPSTFW